MGKIKIKAKLKSIDENLDVNSFAIKNDNKIVYKENEIQVTILILNNRIEMKRVSPEYIIDLIFDEKKDTISTYTFIGGSKCFELNTKTKKLIILDKSISIDYELEGNWFKYTMEMEDVW